MLAYLCLVALVFAGILALTIAEFRRLSIGRNTLKQIKRFDLATLLTIVSGFCMGLPMRHDFGPLLAMVVGLAGAWGIKLLLTELLAGTKWGNDRARLREFRQRHAGSFKIGLTSQSGPRKLHRWWRIRLFDQPVSGPDPRRMPRLKSATGKVRCTRFGSAAD